MNLLHWHVHGSWTTAFVRGPHRYLIPVLPDRGPDGRGRPSRPGTFDWPASAVELPPAALRDAEIDVVVLQRPHERDLAAEWLGGRVPGIDVPAVYVEHNAPQGRINELRHPAADWPGVTIVHVTHFNQTFWDCEPRPEVVIEHGIVDPGYRYTGELAAACVVINEPARRGRVTGTDLLDRFRAALPVDLFGMGSEELGGVDLPQTELHAEMARRRVYVHPIRWTSLGLSLLEAMHLGLPVVALAATEVVEAVPPEAGVLSTSVDRLVAAAAELVADPERARVMGKAAREAALARYGLGRFLADWERVLGEVVAR